MSEFKVDFTKLENKLLKKSYRLADVKDQLETVAFDVVRFKDSDKGASLWQVQSAEDGDYIVTLYDETDNKKTASVADGWEVILSSGASILQKNAMVKTAVVKHLTNGKWQVQSEEGKNLGTYDTKEEADKRLGQVEYFKHNASAKVAKVLNFFYKGDPIVKVASQKLGIPDAELVSVEKYLPKKLASNKKLVAALLSELPETAKKEVLSKYPELL